MRPRSRPLKDLYYRFGQPFNLNWQDVATCLHKASLIDLEPNNHDPNFSHYRDTEKLSRLMDSDDATMRLSQIFEQYKAHRSLAP